MDLRRLTPGQLSRQLTRCRRGRRVRTAAFVLSAALAAISVEAPHAQPADTAATGQAQDWLTSRMPDATRLGGGDLRFLGLKIYRADLYAPPHAAPQRMFETPFALRLTYAREISGGSIAERSMSEIERLGLGTPEQRAHWRSAMTRLFPDVAAGDTLAGLYRPGRGAQFFKNGSALGNVDDPDFAWAFFSIWLSPETRVPELRRALLGLEGSP
jgi:Chalcone isomerase-like